MKTIVWAILGVALPAGLLWGQAPAGGKTAGEAFKNVVVLRDAPQQQFLASMQVISGSLGVPCTYCHAQPYDLDTKPAKVTARSMIKMTLDINARNFDGKQVVSCNTCHQGGTHPNALPAPWSKTPEQLTELKRQQQPAPAPAAPSKTGEALPSVDQVLADYRKAVGADLAKSMHLEGFVSNDLNPRSRAVEAYAALPDKLAFTVSNAGVPVKLLINSDRAWAIAPQGTQELPVEQARAILSLIQPDKLNAQNAKREVTGIEQVDGRTCIRVVSTTSDGVSRLYFEKQSGLLYKVHAEHLSPLGPEPVDTFFDDYGDVGGVKMPFMIVNSPLTDRVVYRFSKIEMNVPIEPAKFDAPAVK